MDNTGPQIIFFGRVMCGDCDAAKGVFAQEEVVFQYKDVRQDEEARTEMEGICRGLGREPAVPVIVINDVAEDRDCQIVFVEPRGPALEALGGAIRPYSLHRSPER